MKSAAFRWCMIGTGTLARNVAKEILASGRHEILSVYSRTKEKRDAFAEAVGAVSCESAEEAVLHPDVEGVYIVTTHPSHYQYAKLALELGKPVLCEKPMTMTAEESRELFQLAKEKGLYLAEGMWTWFGPVAQQVKRWKEEGAFGKIQRVKARYHIDSRGYAPRVTDPLEAGGALLDVGVYPLTYLYRLFGKPVKVVCKGVMKNGIDMKEDILLTFADGAVHEASVSICDFVGLEQILIKGTLAKLRLFFFHGANGVTLLPKGRKPIHFQGCGNYLNEFDCVSQEIRAGLTESRFVPSQATIDVMEIMDECRKQMKLIYPFERV